MRTDRVAIFEIGKQPWRTVCDNTAIPEIGREVLLVAWVVTRLYSRSRRQQEINRYLDKLTGR